MKTVDALKDKLARRNERRTSLDVEYVFADSINFVNAAHWRQVTQGASIFLQHHYLSAIEAHPPENIQLRYVIAYQMGTPVFALACQIAEVSGAQLVKADHKAKAFFEKSVNERLLVCGNLISSGQHSVAYTTLIDDELAWRITAEALYKIRRAEKLNGAINFALIKDFKGEYKDRSSVLERYSYRPIQTDPDMVLTLSNPCKGFEDYLAALTSKYRSRVKKMIRTIDEAGFQLEDIQIDEQIDAELHELYLNVENRANIRLATISQGYFHLLAEALGENLVCKGLYLNEKLAGFITVIKDCDQAVAYYVGFDYALNADYPIYFRLLVSVIEAAIELNCTTISFGRSALEPKASLGALPVETYVWARHRIPAVNAIIRELFSSIPYEQAPERNVMKGIK